MGFQLNVTSIRAAADKAQRYLEYDIWCVEPPPLTKPKGVLIRGLRLVYLLFQSQREDQLRLHAAALTLATLMSLVPLLALALAMLKGMGYQTEFIQFLNDYLSDMPAQFHTFFNDMIALVERTNFARMGGIGAFVLLVMVVGMLGRIENSFNHIWGIRKSRPMRTRFINYLGIVIVVPVLLVIAITLNAQTRLGGMVFDTIQIPRLMPLLATWAAFAILYESMPNTDVRLGPAALSGLLGALLWEGWFHIYITIQPGVTNYNAIYGTLAGIPIFLAWLLVSWSIVLIGAKITFVAQSSGNWRPFDVVVHASWNTRLTLALAVLTHAVRALKGKGDRAGRIQLANDHGIPPRLLEETLTALTEAGLIAELKEHSDEFVLLVDPAAVKLGDLLQSLGNHGEDHQSMHLRGLSKSITGLPQQLVLNGKSSDMTLADLA